MKQNALSGFRLSGKPLNLNAPPPLVGRIITYLEGLRFEDMITTDELAAAIHSTRYSVQGLVVGQGRELLDSLFENVRLGRTTKSLWGSRRTIAALRKALKNAD